MSAAPFDLQGCELRGTRLIEASAGTGKTWTLCGLYLRLLLEQDLPVQRILVVTFTNAATAELRDRIRARLAEALAHLRGRAPDSADPFVATLLQRLRERGPLADADLALRLDLALQSFDEAAIFTIHGFCQRALAEVPFSAGMPMELALLADDSELRLQVVQDFWRRHIAGAALSPSLAEQLLQRKDSPDSLSRLLRRRLAKPLARLLWPAALDVPPTLTDDQADAAIEAAHVAARATWARQRQAVIDHLTEALPRLNGNIYRPDAVQRAVAGWDHWLDAADARAAPVEPKLLALLGRERLQPKKGLQAPAQHPFFEQAQRLLDLHAQRSQSLAMRRLCLLRGLLDAGPAALRQAKREQRVIGFDDMLANLHQRLAGAGGGDLARSLRARFGAALIDEFQDTDPQQYAIFDAIYGDGSAPLVLVGDPKQAIYSFRNADLHVYLHAQRQAQAESTLLHNQRSSRQLLDAQNALFGANPRAFLLDGLRYHAVDLGAKPRQTLVDRSGRPRAALQLWQLPRGDDGEPLPKAQATQVALDACAHEIARLIAAGRRGELLLGERALRAGDIAVLVRSHAQGSAMRRALARCAVRSVELSQASVFDSAEAADLERLLAAILEPPRLPLLRAALATELMGHDAAALLSLSTDEDGLLEWVGRFSGYRDLWLQRGVALMLRRWMQAEDVGRRLLALPDGERRMTNLLHLIECLHEAAAGHAGPEALQRWLQTQRGRPRPDDAAQLRLESDRDLVQVVTIHRSKGLEYPLVFCPLLWDGHPGRAQGGDGLEYHDDAGHAVIDFRTLDKDIGDEVRARRALERDAETMRLIYVALTRAMQRCHLVVGTYRRRTAAGWSTAESCRARLHWLVAGVGLTPAQWLKRKPEAEQVEAAWIDFARQHAPAVALDPVPPGQEALPAAACASEAQDLAALPPPGHIPHPWRIGSYSSLAHGARHEGAALDHDLRVAEVLLPDDDAALPADDILHFPRGASAGDCLHAVFEQVDFDDAAAWPAAVDRVLHQHAQALANGAAQPSWQRMLLRMLGDVLHTPLPGAMRLADVPRQRRLTEMEFHLPAPLLDARVLSSVMRQQGLALPPLAFGTLRGYLRGYIDLVFEHAGRYHLLDWKSNHLGHTPADYAAPALGRVMDAQGYHLQALLYALALHRHLQQRLPDYRHERNFGGVMYLFVRGVRPGWMQPDGTPCGVHVQRPGLPLLQALSRAIGDPGEAP